MSKTKNNGPLRIPDDPVHPTVAVAVLLAKRAYASRTTDITTDDLDRMFDSVCVGDDWNNPPVDLRTVVLMVMAALQFGLWIEATICPLNYGTAAKGDGIEALYQAVKTTGLIEDLGRLANHLATDAKLP